MSITLRSLTDVDLELAIASLKDVERTASSALIAHLAELEDRKLHLARGFKSLFGYCHRVLHCSEYESYGRMQAVHAARRFPVILPMLAEGLLHLTAVRLLAPHLRDEDHLALLGGAIHKSKRAIAKSLAGWFPSEDVASTIRKLPTVAAADNSVTAAGQGAESLGPMAAAAPSPTTPAAVRPTAPAIVAPLSADRYRVTVTVSNAAHDDLRFLQDALRREIPNGDPAEIVARALAALRQVVEKRLFSATDRPRAAAPTASTASRDIPADVERAVWRRDQGQCSFEGPHHRCEERAYLEYHHLTPWIVGGQPSVENIALRCRAHNEYESRVYFAPIHAARVDYYDSFRNEFAAATGGAAG